MQGFGLSDTLGVAGFPNGEAQKSSFPMPRFNIARVFLRQTFGLGGEQETIEDGPNQLAGKQDISRITVTAGKFAVTTSLTGMPMPMIRERIFSIGISTAVAPTTGPWTRSATRGALSSN